VTAYATLTHRCIRGRQCGDHEPTPDGGRLGAATEAPDSLCRGCERRAGHAVAELPRLYTELETIIGHKSASGEHVSGTREQPTPPRLDVVVLQADIDATLYAWAAPVASRCRIPWDGPRVRRLRPGPRVHRSAHILSTNLDALLRLPDIPVDVWTVHGVTTVRASGLEGVLRLLRLHQRGRQLVTGGTGDARLPVPCPQCEAPALVRANGHDQVDCRACSASWPEADYRRLCLILAEDYRPARGRPRRGAACR
jgi:hypothetical protein